MAPQRVAACIVVCVTAWLAASPASTASRALAAARHPRLIVISIDGMMPASYTAADSPAVTIRERAMRGAWASSVIGVWPTNTRPSHATLLTGVTPGVHGIVDNDVLDPERRTNPTFNWFAYDIKVPTLVSAARTAGLTSAVVMWPASAGMAADFLVPTFGWTHPRDINLLRALSTPGLLDEFERTVAPFQWPPSDAQRVDLATFLLTTRHPDLLLLYFGTLDAFAHTYGAANAMTASSLRDMDRLVKRLLATLETRHLLDGAYVAVVSDHGYIDVDHATGPNTAFAHEGLIEVDTRGRILTWRAFSHGSGGSSFVYLKDPSDPVLRAQVRSILQALTADARSGIDRIVEHDELVTAGADPAAAFGIAMQPGYSLIEDTDRLFGQPFIRAMHGYPPSNPAMNASFFLNGPGLDKIGDLGTVRMTQIAPTLARLLGVTLSPKADAPIDRIVRAAK